MKINKLLMMLLFACCATSAYADSTWDGTYFYDVSLGETFGGSAIVLTYTLVMESGKCEVSVVGYQVDEVLICKAVATGNNVAVTFQSYANGKVESEYGAIVYKPSSVLLQLTGGKELITTWGELLPHESLAKKGKYFEKQP